MLLKTPLPIKGRGSAIFSSHSFECFGHPKLKKEREREREERRQRRKAATAAVGQGRGERAVGVLSSTLSWLGKASAKARREKEERKKREREKREKEERERGKREFARGHGARPREEEGGHSKALSCSRKTTESTIGICASCCGAD